MTNKYQYLSDVLEARRNESDAEQVRWAKSDAKQKALIAKFTPRTDLHPAIGILTNIKGIRYYAFVNGVYREGTPEHLESLLTA
jgi:hypothetical protein